ncbi:MAG: SDR family oxidoreductase [Ancalomicrobiaceae bacterium]|nr:SDR family oxidoreductase [Ancalomicrobiaceae bacterium]
MTDAATAAREQIDVEMVRQRSYAQIPMGRYGEPEEVAAVAAFLCRKRRGIIKSASDPCFDAGPQP